MSIFRKLLLPIVALLLFCQNSSKDSTAELPFVAEYTMQDVPLLEAYEGPVSLGTLSSPQIDEASGLAASALCPQCFWTHNDSGDTNRIFLLDQAANLHGTVILKNAVNRDWEDMTAGPGPEDGVRYLYIGDIGDNRQITPLKTIYRIPEPHVELSSESAFTIEVDEVAAIRFTLPDGPADVESLMIDPWTKDVYLVTKRVFPTRVYRLAYPQSTSSVSVAELVGSILFVGAVAGDSSPDGKKWVIKTMTTIYMWQRNEGESVSQAFMREPVRLPYVPEQQGEAFTWDLSDNAYYTLSEWVRQAPDLNVYLEKHSD